MGRARPKSFRRTGAKTRRKAGIAAEPGTAADFGAAVADFGRSILADARRSLTDPALSQPECVHEVRKALKRWRALMRLLSKPLGGEADRRRSEARDLMRSLATARDAQSALDALADLRRADAPLAAASMETITARIVAIRDAAERNALTPDIKQHLVSYLDDAAHWLDRWPLAALDFDAVADGLAATYRRARKLIPEKWSGVTARHLHALRKRVVEHRHQMELIEHLWPRLGRVWAEETQRLRSRLGACQDLAVLEGLAASHQPLARWRSRLHPCIASRRREHLKTSARLAGRLFAEKPKAFRRRIAALWSHRLSHAGEDA
jgi:CHAD domain-containing protein